ncbi:MAG TPA: hypothetical protein PLG42_07720, partial [Bacteroidales bacterium]|nr:hypothetical protein [Bacteroidales bacterium]
MKRGRKVVAGILLTLFFSLYTADKLIAQDKNNERPPFKERLFWGGSFSLQLGTLTDIEIAPVVGVWLLPRLAIAGGPNYRFYKFLGEQTDIYGIQSYLQVVLLRDIDKLIPIGSHTSIVLQVDNELLSLESSFWKGSSYIPGESKRFLVNTPLIGGGLSQQIGR